MSTSCVPKLNQPTSSANADLHAQASPACLLLLLMPLLLLSINDKWAFTPEGCTDAWAYFGHYLNLAQHLNLFGESYVSNRLSVSLPGYLAYRFLPPLAANYALRLGLYYASVLSLYLIVRWTISPRAGLLAGLSLGCEFFFLRAIGWDYVDGFGISYFLLTALALTAAARRPGWKSYLVAGGMGSSALVVANLFYVVFVPYLVLHYLYLNRQGRRNPLWRSFFLYVLGAGALLLVLALFTWWVAGRFFFLSQSLHFSSHSVGTPNAWVEPVSTWLLGADWLVFAALTAVGSLIFIWSNRADRRPNGAATFYQCQFLAYCAILVACQSFGLPFLQCSFYASMLLPAAFIAFGSQLAAHVDLLSTRSFRVLLVIVLMSLLAPYALSTAGQLPEKIRPWSGILTVAAGILGIMWVATGHAHRLAAGVLIGLFVAVPTCVAWSTFALSKCFPRTTVVDGIRTYPGENYGSADFLRIVADSVKVIQKWDRCGQGRFWYAVTTPQGRLHRAVCSTYLFMYRLVNEDFPSLGDYAAFAKLRHRRVWVLSDAPGALEQVGTALKEHGLEARLLAEERLGTPSLGYTMSYVAIMPLGVREQPLTIQFDASATKGTLIGASEGDMQFLSAEAWRPWYPVAKSLWANYYFHLGQKALNRLFHRRSADSGLRIGLRPSDSGLELTTAPPSFAYALSYCPLTVAAAGNYRFELKYRRHHGDVTFGALSEDKTEWLAQAWSGDAPFASEKPGVLVTSFTVRLTAGQTVILMLANNNPGTDTPSRVVIEDVRAYRDISSEER